MGEPGSSQAAAAAATASPSDESDERIARKLHVMEQLVHVFGFPHDRAEEAIDAVFMNDLENEFGAESDDFNDDDMDEDGYTQSEKP